MRNAFVVGEFAVALALLTGAGFLMDAFNRLTEADPGFRQEGLLTFSLQAQEDRYPEPEDLRTYEDALLASLAEVPGVQGVAAMASLPRGRGNPDARYTVAGRPVPEEGEQPTAGYQTVNPRYFATMEIPLVQGRLFEATDRDDSQPVALVSEALVRREFAGEDPLGRTLTVRGADRVIVGVVQDVIQDRIALAGDQGEAIYVPLAQAPLRAVSFALRADGDPTRLASDVRRAVWAVNPDQPVAQLRTLDDFVAESLAGPRTISLFLAGMGLMALLLAAMGIYGVMAHAVAQQQREIGIRMALGAGRNSVVTMVTRSGLGLAGMGMVVGIPLSYLMYRAASSALNLFEGGVAFGYALKVAAALATVSVIATVLPARKASGVQPVAALRD